MIKTKQKRPTVKRYLQERLKNIPLTVLMGLFTAFCFASLIYFAVIGGHSRDCIISMVYFLIVPVFYLLEYALNVRAPLGYTAFMLIFVLFCFLGACYNFYTIIPCLDDILHACWGIVFAVIGIIIAKFLIGTPDTVKGVILFVVFGIGAAMIFSIIWEIYEYVGDKIIPDMDMQEDTVVHSIHSFMLHDPYDHLHAYKIDGIIKTVVTTESGEVIELPIEGYLDVGIVDTMQDLIWCFVTAIVFSVILAIDWCKRKYFYRFFIPALLGEKYDKAGAYIGQTSETEAAEEEKGADVAPAAEAADIAAETPAEAEQTPPEKQEEEKE